MMKCTQCNSDLSPNFSFCPSCGQQAVKVCTTCGTICPFKEESCSQCGHSFLQVPVHQDEKQTSELAEPASISKEADTSTTNRIRKHSTVLFVDIKGSTSKIEDLDPEEARELLGPAVEEMLHAVYYYNGTIVHTAGDGIVAVFGTPIALEDHALRACLAAVMMQNKVKSKESELELRIGINTGEVLLEVVGDDKHHEYDIIGPTVNLAARMEQTAKPGTIQLTYNTLNLIQHQIEVTALGQMEIKGFHKPIQVFALNSVKESKLLSEVKSRSILLPFLGRDEEMALLNNLIVQVKQGKGNALGLSAEAGQGKSRLIYEFFHSTSVKEFNLLVSGAFSHTSTILWLPITDLLRRLMNISVNEHLETIKEKIQPYISKTDSPHALNAILALLDVPMNDPTWNAVPPESKRNFMRKVGIEVLMRYSLQRPLIIIIEDMHWVDGETDSFLNLLISHIESSNIFLLRTYRPEYIDAWIERPNYTQLQLKRLTRETEETILDYLLGSNVSLQDIKTKILNRCIGNPFFLEEMVQSLIYDNVLIGKANNYYLNPAVVISSINLPETIYAVLQTQIDNLSSIKQEIMRKASVIGEQFSYFLIRQLVEINEKDLRRNLSELTDDRLIFEVEIYPELKFSFKHALIQEVVYSSILKTVRRTLHRQILSLFESFTEAQQTDQMHLMANHAYLGEDWVKAFDYCFKVGEKAFSLDAMYLAAQLYEKAVIAANHIEIYKEASEKLMVAYFAMILAFLRLGLFDKQSIYINEVRQLAKAANNKCWECVVDMYHCMHILGLPLNCKESFEYAERSYSLALESNDKYVLMTGQLALIHSYTWLSKYDELFSTIFHLLGHIEDLNYRYRFFKVPYGYLAIYYLAFGCIQTGNFEYIEDRRDQILSLTDMDQPSISSVFADSAIGYVSFVRGNFEEAAYHLSRALKHTTSCEMVVVFPCLIGPLACSYLRLNRIEEGKKMIKQAIDFAKNYNYCFMNELMLGTLSEGLMLLGEYNQAKELTQEMLQIAQERKIDGQISCLLRLSSEIDLHLPQPNFAEIQLKLNNALQIATEHGIFVQIAHCHLALAELNRQMGEQNAHFHELKVALEYYEKFNIPYLIKKCEDKLITMVTK